MAWEPDAGAVFRFHPPPYPERAELQRMRVSRVISPDDAMHRAGRYHYFEFGRAALTSIRAARVSVGSPPVGSILDLPSGHGRVLRYLTAAFPEANVVACDIDRDAVDFCAATLGAQPVYSAVHPSDIQLDREFDVIWVGSLLTHLDAPFCDEFLDFFARHLSNGGVLVMSFHGTSTATCSARATSPSQSRAFQI